MDGKDLQALLSIALGVIAAGFLLVVLAFTAGVAAGGGRPGIRAGAMMRDVCPICASASSLNSTPSKGSTTLILRGHRRCQSCGVLMGLGHVEANLNNRCSWCILRGNTRGHLRAEGSWAG